MSKPQVKIYNSETGEEVVRDANKQELAQMEIDAANFEANRIKAEEKIRERQAILDRLGLTADEAQLLLG